MTTKTLRRTSERLLSAARNTKTASSKLLVETGADPWVVYYNNQYYYCHSMGERLIAVNSAKRLEDIGLDNHVVWAAPEGSELSEEVWAPELHHIDNKWYIYFTAGKAENHRMYVLESVSKDPQGEYVLKAKISDPTDRWAIDGTVVKIKNINYFIWSGWGRGGDGTQSLYIAKMSNPWTISGERTCISMPGYSWEHAEIADSLRGPNSRLPSYDINEAPQALWHGKNLYIIFSASHTITGDYCMGQLTYTGGDPLSKDSWLKLPKPVFCKTDTFQSPGHASFVKVGINNWVIYHVSKYPGSGFDRQVLAQKFSWHKDGSPNFATPLPLSSKSAVAEKLLEHSHIQ